MSNEKSALLLAAHGSRGAVWNREVHALADRVRAIDTFPIVELAFLGLVRPAIPEGVEACVARGAKSIVVVPLFLFSATHVRRDIPAALEQASRRFPRVTIKQAPPFGADEEIVTVLEERLTAAARRLAVPSDAPGVVLAAGGTADRQARGVLEQAAAHLGERVGNANIQIAFLEMEDPTLEEGLSRAAAAGAQGIVILPYFLFSGTLVGRIAKWAREWGRRYPKISLTVGRHLGPHPSLATLAVRRARELE